MGDNHNTISNDSHTEPSAPMETAVVTAAAAKTTTTTTSRKQVSYGQTQSMPVRLPSSYPHYSPTTPQQRWRLLKTVRRAQTAMTRSLQVEERELLHHMTKNTSATTTTTTTMTLDPQTFLCPTTTTNNTTAAAAASSLSTSTLPSSLPEVAQEAKDGDDHNDDDEPDVKDDLKNAAHHQVAADDDDENDAKVAAAAAESESEYYDCPNRQELWQVLEEDHKKIKSQRSSFFTPKEHDYLRQLIQTPKIPSDYVAKARQSVVSSIQRQQALLLTLQQEYGDDDNDHDDNDHDDDNHDEGEHEAGLEVDYKHHTDQEDHPPPSTQTTKGRLPETKAPIRKSLFRASVAAKGNTKQPTSQLLQQQQQQALPARDASFRQELWSWSSRSLASPKKGGQPQQPQEQQEQPQEPLEADSTTTFSSPTPILSSLFGFFMGGGSSNSNNNNNANKAEEATVDTTTDDLNDNNDNEFDDWDDTIVLGTTTGGHDPECQPHVLTPPLMYALRPHLPLSLRCDHYWLKYSLVRDGASMRTLVRHIRSSARTLLAVETTTGHVLGCFCSAPWTPHGSAFFGSGEAFCWKLAQSRYTRGRTTLEEQVALEQDVRVFSWSGQNRNVQRLVKEYSELMVGGGRPDDDLLDPTKFTTTTTTTATTNAPRTKSMILRDKYGSALVLSPDLERGYSHPCVTFQSPRLCCDSRSNDQEVTKKGDGGEEVSCAGTATEPPFTTTTTTTSTTTSQPPVKNNNNEDEGNENFNILNVEVWTWTPMDTVEEAEKVELGRRFIFDNGAFLES